MPSTHDPYRREICPPGFESLEVLSSRWSGPAIEPPTKTKSTPSGGPMGKPKPGPAVGSRAEPGPESPKERLAIIKRLSAEWFGDLDADEGRFRTHVYENPDPKEFDFLQHRMLLHFRIAGGISLYIGLADLNKLLSISDKDLGFGSEDLLPLAKQLANKVTELSRIFFEWHSPVDNDEKLPASLRQGLLEAEAEDHVPMDI